MKIRQGFVSNSSSSSFVLVAKKDEFYGVVKDMHPYIQHMVRQGTTHQFGEDTMIFFSGVDSSEEPPYEIDGYLGELLGTDLEKVVGVATEENEYVPDWSAGYPAYVGEILYRISEKMKEQNKPVIYSSEYN